MSGGALRVGVAGTAFWAEAAHLPGLRQVPEVELVGLWGRNQGRAETLAGANGVRAFPSFEAMLDAVDAVSFAVPPPVQAGLALRAAEAGRHLLLEKPVAFTAEDAAAIAETVDRKNLACVVFFTRRYIPEVASGIVALRARRWTRAEVTMLGGALVPGSPYEASVWRNEPHAAVWDLAPHVLSVLDPVLGPVRTLTVLEDGAEESTLRSEHAGADGSTAVATIRLSLRAPPERQGNTYVFHGASGTATLPEPPMDRPAVFAHAVRDLVRAVRTGERSACDARFGAEITRAITEALR